MIGKLYQDRMRLMKLYKEYIYPGFHLKIEPTGE